MVRLIGTTLMIAAGASAAGPACAQDRLYACGNDQVREYRIDEAGGAPAATETWRWSAAAATSLPDAYRETLLAKIDECKPVDDDRAILVTASTGGVALIDRATGRTTFHATAPMAHSADLLPGGLIAVALSIHADGDRLDIYDRRRSERVLFSLPLPSGHGVVWDPSRERLYALSHDRIQGFRVAGSRRAPRLEEAERWTLPGRRDGHDLSRRPDGGYLVTTDDGAWTFDPESGAFAPQPGLNPMLRVKAVNLAGEGDAARLAWVQAEESWWAGGFSIARADGQGATRIPVEALRLYKVRWIH